MSVVEEVRKALKDPAFLWGQGREKEWLTGLVEEVTILRRALLATRPYLITSWKYDLVKRIDRILGGEGKP